ncbi:hypothetical protein [Rouxiella chamberiensis]|uniref:Zinc ribbon domain-containing protein n=1 Tax=Rouxiella chamberiensis TaxID=1513468 RepID=A0ABY7HQN4_9GAMM|nr:hypothetical protein [Rouxiella chamberiensis]WAT01480.1 hypothetical protein O1V66_01430 [Rouxiella chamberiensis]
MNKKATNNVGFCPFCSGELNESPANCHQCGAAMMKGHIDKTQRKWMLFLRVILLIATALNYIYLSPILEGDELITVFVISISVSLVLPYIYFKLKNISHSVWIRKPLSW